MLSRTLMMLIVLTVLAGCNLPKAGSTPTLDVTQAYQTVEARLTQAAALTPSNTPSPTDDGTATETSTPGTTTPTVTTEPTSGSSASGQLCDQASAGVPIDVTIPDDTKMQPGQSFTKTWRLQNSGTCTWGQGYSIALFSGEGMGAPASAPIPVEVPPGKSVDISIDMVAPLAAGTYQGNWKLRNAANTWFGIGPGASSPFWVRIVVVGSSTGTTTSTPTVTSTSAQGGSTPTPTNTSSSAVQVSGTTNLIPTDKINLDTNQINPGGGADLSYGVVDDQLSLAPAGSAIVGVYGSSTPTIDDCQGAAKGASPLPLESLYQGVYLCYRTDQGLFGWARLLNLELSTNTLTIQILTWAVQ